MSKRPYNRKSYTIEERRRIQAYKTLNSKVRQHISKRLGVVNDNPYLMNIINTKNGKKLESHHKSLADRYLKILSIKSKGSLNSYVVRLIRHHLKTRHEPVVSTSITLYKKERAKILAKLNAQRRAAEKQIEANTMKLLNIQNTLEAIKANATMDISRMLALLARDIFYEENREDIRSYHKTLPSDQAKAAIGALREK
jgi:hypothetical protein